MHEGWAKHNLGEVSEVLRRGITPKYVDSLDTDSIVVLNQKCIRDGKVDLSLARVTKRVPALKEDRILKRGDILINSTGRGTLGRTARWNQDIEATVDSHVTILRPSTVVDASFLGVVLGGREDEIESLASGSTSQTELSPASISSMLVWFPPLPEQKRIVDLIGAVDGAIDEASQTLRATDNSLNAFLDRLHSPRTTPLGELAAMRSGPSWNSKQESESPVEGAVPVLSITNTKADGRLDLSDRRFVSGLPDSVMRLSENSLVIIRTNGNRARIGNVYRSVAETVGHAVSAFQIAVEPLDPSMSSYLYWALRAPNMQERMSNAASGSTGLGNIAIGWLKNLELPQLDEGNQIAFVELCEAFHGVQKCLHSKLNDLRTLRFQLLSSLLSGHHRIPESYDELLEAQPEFVAV
ncbi:restriction endonuclease subunit S [Arthrobacter sp. GCM10027362]|uniref:restriction endonuclease subunit S n=1 Tax=Arthrobacter sp. GCM10027362 TaxID=3273379 RepID=UPI00362C06CF